MATAVIEGLIQFFKHRNNIPVHRDNFQEEILGCCALVNKFNRPYKVTSLQVYLSQSPHFTSDGNGNWFLATEPAAPPPPPAVKRKYRLPNKGSRPYHMVKWFMKMGNLSADSHEVQRCLFSDTETNIVNAQLVQSDWFQRVGRGFYRIEPERYKWLINNNIWL